jgi:ssDNA-binding Zn-finger/Zn-ribbon topoisomerase 1
MTVGPRSHYVRCVGYPLCKFASHRRGDTPEAAEGRPCPRCGGPVVVIQRPDPRSPDKVSRAQARLGVP